MQSFNDAAKRFLMLADGAFEFRHLGGKLFIGRYGLPKPDKGRITRRLISTALADLRTMESISAPCSVNA